MASKLDRLYTPQSIKNIIYSYKRNSILDVAAEFGTSHETIRKILKANKIRLRKKGEYTDETKIHMAAYKCANIIRQYPPDLMDEILSRLNKFLE